MFGALCFDIHALHQCLQCSWVLSSYTWEHAGQEQTGNTGVMFCALCLNIHAVHQRLQCSWVLSSYT